MTSHLSERSVTIEDLKSEAMEECCCEVAGCTMPCTICPACQRCFCWQHLQSSSCEVCRNLVARHSFEYRLGRLVSIGLSTILLSVLLFFLPRDAAGITFQLAIFLMLCGLLLFWLGLLGQT